MNKIPKFALIAAFLFSLQSCTAVAESFNDEQKSEIEQIIYDYLLREPELIEKAQKELERRKVEQERLAAIATIHENSDILFQSSRDAVLGNPVGDVTMVEFFDYNCGYCKRALVEILQLLEEDGNLRLVLKEFPVLGKESVEAAQVSVAAHRVDSEKYADFHQKLLLGQNKANRENALSLAEDMGFDMEALNREMQNQEVVAAIEEAYSIAGKLNLNGTPSFVVGEKVVKGAIPLDSMRALIETARNSK